MGAAQARVSALFQFPRVVVAEDAHGAETHVGLAVQPGAQCLGLGHATDEERFFPAFLAEEPLSERAGQETVGQQQQQVERRHEARDERARVRRVLRADHVREPQARAEEGLAEGSGGVRR